MFKKTITYLDYNGLEIKEDFYFNLTKAEIMEMQLQKIWWICRENSKGCRRKRCSRTC